VKPSKTFLIVDDDEEILNLLQEWLLENGIGVLRSSNGMEALEICKDPNHRIDLVLADVIMPKMDGMELYEELQKIKPDLKVILTSIVTPPNVFLEKFPNCKIIPKSHNLSKLLDQISAL
jgi:two-component system cell cycle sensor histidine kinase/response regulator CckA